MKRWWKCFWEGHNWQELRRVSSKRRYSKTYNSDITYDSYAGTETVTTVTEKCSKCARIRQRQEVE